MKPCLLIPAAVLWAMSPTAATAQAPPCYDRDAALPANNPTGAAEICHSKIRVENTTNDRHAIALYNAARFYNVASSLTADASRKAAFYSAAVSDILESRERASDDNPAFHTPWRRGDKNSRTAQDAANRFFLADRSYQLGKAYLGLAELGDARTCGSPENCLERAADELEHNPSARLAGGYYEDYVFLRANVYLAWRQLPFAKRDLEALRTSARFSGAASEKLGALLLAEANTARGDAKSPTGLAQARQAYRAALDLPSAGLRAQLGLAETYLDEASLNRQDRDRRENFRNSRREYDLAVQLAHSQADAALKRQAFEGRGRAAFELARLEGDAATLENAISDLSQAADQETGLAGAPAQLMLARALSEARRAPEADAAFTEAERRFGIDPRVRAARADHAYARGRQDFDNGSYGNAEAHFRQAVGESAWLEDRADAYFFLSAIRLQSGTDARPDADAAVAAGDGKPQYRDQACLVRVAAGGAPVLGKSAFNLCAGKDVLEGLFYLRYAQFGPNLADRTSSRRLAQAAFDRARVSQEQISTFPHSPQVLVSDIAIYGSAVALGCSSALGMTVPVELDQARLARAAAFFKMHHVHACTSND
jgi:hypothetical protein